MLCIAFRTLHPALHTFTLHTPVPYASRFIFCIPQGMLYTSHPPLRPELHTPHLTLHAPTCIPYLPDSTPCPTLKIRHSKFQVPGPQSALHFARPPFSMLFASPSTPSTLHSTPYTLRSVHVPELHSTPQALPQCFMPCSAP